jgi:hypothetical protein
VIAQDTGFTEWMRTGSGVWAFADLEQAVAAVEAVTRDHASQCAAARAMAAEYFDSERVLGDLLARAMVLG